MLISKNHLKARFTASKDKSRPVLTAIQLSAEDDEVVAVATNGYILSEIREEMPDEQDFPKVASTGIKEMKVQADTAASVSKALKTNKHLPILNFAHVGTEGITVTDLEHTQEFKDHPIEGNFPEYKKLLPDADKAKAVVTINPEFLATMCKLFKDESSVTLEIHDKFEPVVIRSSQDGHTITGVIMPLKT